MISLTVASVILLLASLSLKRFIKNEPPTLVAMIGICSISYLLYISAYFAPIQIGAFLAMGLAAFWGIREIGVKNAMLLFILTLLCSWICSGPIITFDTSLYHCQLIKWLHEHGLVRGVALIDERLGLQSAWYTIPAIFLGQFPKGEMLNVANCAALSAVAFGFIRQLLMGKSDQSNKRILGYAILILVGSISRIAVSPSVDFPILVLSMETLFCMIDRKHSLALILSAFAVGLKLSALPLFLIAIVWWAMERKSKEKIMAAAIMVAVIGIVTIFSNITTSGYIAYPSTVLKMPVKWAMQKSQLIEGQKSLALDYYGGFGDVHLQNQNPASSWPYFWARKHYILFASLIFSLSITIALALRKRPIEWKLIALFYLAILAVFLTNPDGRFVQIYAIPLVALLAIYLPLPKLGRISGGIALLVALAWPWGAYERGIANKIPIATRIIQGIPAETGTFIQRNNGSFDYLQATTEEKMYLSDLPASRKIIPTNVIMINPQKGISAGFLQLK